MPTAETGQSGKGNRWCSTPKDADEFRQAVFDEMAYLLVAHKKAMKVSLDFHSTG
jgi:hypothetical protein